MKAVQLLAKGSPPTVVADRPIPSLPPNCLLIKTSFISLNPHDLVDIYPPFSFSDPGNLLGCDYAGTVEEVGSEVTRAFKKGDRVCGCTRPNPLQPDWGTFAEYIIVVGDVQMRVPDEISLKDAAALGVGILTTGAALYDVLNLPIPPAIFEPRQQILVYGGSTSTGRMILQFAKISNLETITTCSPSNFELVKSFGADHILDYNDPTAPVAIRRLTKGTLSLCIDCFSQQSSYAFCAQALGTGATYVCIGPINLDREDLDFRECHGVLYFGAPFLYQGHVLEASKEKFESAVRFAGVVEGLLGKGEIMMHPTDLREGGLEGILQGLEEMKEGRVRGKKLVYQVA